MTRAPASVIPDLTPQAWQLLGALARQFRAEVHPELVAHGLAVVEDGHLVITDAGLLIARARAAAEAAASAEE